jgi:hypothetical protein
MSDSRGLPPWLDMSDSLQSVSLLTSLYCVLEPTSHLIRPLMLRAWGQLSALLHAILSRREILRDFGGVIDYKLHPSACPVDTGRFWWGPCLCQGAAACTMDWGVAPSTQAGALADVAASGVVRQLLDAVS